MAKTYEQVQADRQYHREEIAKAKKALADTVKASEATWNRSRGQLTFAKTVVREARRAHGSSLCPKCKVEHGNQREHTIDLEFARDHEETAREFFRSIGVPCETVDELRAALKSGDNLGLLCGRCHYEKTQQERNAITPQERLIIALNWRLVSFTPNGKRRTVTAKTIEKAKAGAQKIAKADKVRRYHMAKGNADLAHKAAKRRAAHRREARGIV